MFTPICEIHVVVLPVFIAVPAIILSDDIVSGGLCYKFITKAFKRLIHFFFKISGRFVLY